jgi:hypothetical protein
MEPSDKVQDMKLEVTWEPTNGVLGMNLAKEDMFLGEKLKIVGTYYLSQLFDTLIVARLLRMRMTWISRL